MDRNEKGMVFDQAAPPSKKMDLTRSIAASTIPILQYQSTPARPPSS